MAVLAAACVGGPVQAQVLPPTSNTDLFGSSTSAQTDPQQQQQTQTQQAPQQSQSATSVNQSSAASQSFQPTSVEDRPTTTFYSAQDLLKAQQQGLLDVNNRALKPPKPGEFEDYVAHLIGRRLPRYGQDLVLPSQRDFAMPATASIPPDYLLNVGDTVSIAFTGSLSGSLEREIDNTGRIFLPDIGSVSLAGVPFGDLKERITRAVGSKYRNFTVSVSVKQLRGIRVYVTGFANNPGAFTVSSLSTLANAVFQAGGPSAGGSFRSVKLYRGGHEVADFDLYRLLRHGNRDGDVILQNEDVLFIPPAGEQVAVIGSVQQEAIYETLPGESLEAALQIAGGPNVLGDPNRLVVYDMRGPQIAGPRIVARSEARQTAIMAGDILQVLSKGSLQQPVDGQSVVVRIEGEVSHPGNYYLPPGTPISVVVEAAGGLTGRAYPYGAKLERQSVREQQKESYQEALRQVEFMLASAPLITDSSVTSEQRTAQASGARAILEQLKQLEPDGRVVMLLPPTATALPGSVLLENNDRILVPPRPTTVGVFGAVYRQGSFLIDGAPMHVRDYVDRAGGTQRAADKSNIFVVRANGEVLTQKKGALNAPALPGDVVFVPVKVATTNWWARFQSITNVVFDFALTAAAIHSLQ
jgi:polysaccharide export outer membrane protein